MSELIEYETNPFVVLDTKESVSIMWHLINRLDTRMRAVVVKRLGLEGRAEPKTLKAIAYDLGLSIERVRQLFNRGVSILRIGYNRFYPPVPPPTEPKIDNNPDPRPIVPKEATVKPIVRAPRADRPQPRHRNTKATEETEEEIVARLRATSRQRMLNFAAHCRIPVESLSATWETANV